VTLNDVLNVIKLRRAGTGMTDCCTV